MQYYLLVNNKAEGPFTEDELKELPIFPEILIKTNETQSWQPAFQFDELQSFFNSNVSRLETNKNKINSVIYSNNYSSDTKNWSWIIFGITLIMFAVLLLFLVQSQKQRELQLQLNELYSIIKQQEPQKQDTARQKQLNKIGIE